MMRVVLDTNVFVSAMLGGALAAVIEHWQAGRFTLIVTDEIVGEYLAVLRRPKFGLPTDVVDAIIGYVFRKAEFVTPAERLRVVEADPKDDKFLEAAVAGEAVAIVSGDRHLSSLQAYRGIPVVTPREFLNRLASETSVPEPGC
jgi:putative PIN family toxin of toxin-antitoxin system